MRNNNTFNSLEQRSIAAYSSNKQKKKEIKKNDSKKNNSKLIAIHIDKACDEVTEYYFRKELFIYIYCNVDMRFNSLNVGNM